MIKEILIDVISSREDVAYRIDPEYAGNESNLAQFTDVELATLKTYLNVVTMTVSHEEHRRYKSTHPDD
jgi:hypothetical protein